MSGETDTNGIIQHLVPIGEPSIIVSTNRALLPKVAIELAAARYRHDVSVGRLPNNNEIHLGYIHSGRGIADDPCDASVTLHSASVGLRRLDSGKQLLGQLWKQGVPVVIFDLNGTRSQPARLLARSYRKRLEQAASLAGHVSPCDFLARYGWSLDMTAIILVHVEVSASIREFDDPYLPEWLAQWSWVESIHLGETQQSLRFETAGIRTKPATWNLLLKSDSEAPAGQRLACDNREKKNNIKKLNDSVYALEVPSDPQKANPWPLLRMINRHERQPLNQTALTSGQVYPPAIEEELDRLVNALLVNPPRYVTDMNVRIFQHKMGKICDVTFNSLLSLAFGSGHQSQQARNVLLRLNYYVLSNLCDLIMASTYPVDRKMAVARLIEKILRLDLQPLYLEEVCQVVRTACLHPNCLDVKRILNRCFAVLLHRHSYTYDRRANATFVKVPDSVLAELLRVESILFDEVQEQIRLDVAREAINDWKSDQLEFEFRRQYEACCGYDPKPDSLEAATSIR